MADEKAVYPDVVYVRGIEWQHGDGVSFDVSVDPAFQCDTTRVKKVGVYRLEKFVNVGANVIVTDVYDPDKVAVVTGEGQ
jgi:hypothetical protein